MASTNQRDALSVSNSNTCVVCYKGSEYHSVGMCDHPVCYECSTRMRVLCKQNECPICRQDLPRVVFTQFIKPFRHLRRSENLVDQRYNIFFENREVREKFFDLLAHCCKFCRGSDTEFDTFRELKRHMKLAHNLYYCDLCVDNLKIFSLERRCYTKSELDQHMKEGDVDDRSHRGHPLCEFCEKRYMDNDELYRHLRRDHLFCHFCDADGYHQYYSSYNYLRDHFRKQHFLCEEAGCADQEFTGVFRTEIDLKAHKYSVHGKQLGKAAAKQARTLEVEFHLAPRPHQQRNARFPPGPNSSRGRNHEDHHHHPPRSEEYRPPTPEEQTFVRQPLVDVQSTEQFPTLGNAAPATGTNVPQHHSHHHTRGGRGNFTIRSTLRPQSYHENFPALGNDSSNVPAQPTASQTLAFSLSSSRKTQPQQQHQPLDSQRSQNVAPNVSIRVNHRPNGTVTTTRLSGQNIRIQPGSSNNDFPALGRSDRANHSTNSDSNNAMKWTKISCTKPQANKSNNPSSKKVAPPPLLSPPSPPPIRSGNDFPSLGSKANNKSGGATVSVTPSTSNWVQSQASDLGKTTSQTTSIEGTKSKTKKKKKPKEPQQQQQQQQSSQKTESSNKKTPKTPKSATSTESTSNNPVRKRSELKIDNLNSNNENFPALNGGNSSQSSAVPKPPPGFSTQPPPGFAPNPLQASSAPPPGFNGLCTFTSSSGETYNIVPPPKEIEEPVATYGPYIPPPNFQRRNKNLVAQLNGCFDGMQESDELKTFRFLSGLYRAGDCTAEEYYEQCRAALGTFAFQEVFPELLSLLPDVKKQRELYAVHRKNQEKFGGRVDWLEICQNCGQVLRGDDLREHANAHRLENHFPVLSGSGGTASGVATWSKNAR